MERNPLPLNYLRLTRNIVRALLVLAAVFFMSGSISQAATADIQLDIPINSPVADLDPAPLAAPAINLSLNLPDAVFLGEDFSFEVIFDTTGDIGYGPFIDLIFPVNGIDGAANTSSLRDGFDFVSATYLGTSFPAGDVYQRFFSKWWWWYWMFRSPLGANQWSR